MNSWRIGLTYAYTIILFLCIGSEAYASDSKKVLVLPLVPSSETFQPMADEATMILEKKLSLRQIPVLSHAPFLMQKEFGLSEPLTSENITSIERQIWNENEIEWVIGGALAYLGMDMDRREGSAILGVSRIPIHVNIHVYVYDVRANEMIGQIEESGSMTMPVLRIFGFFRDPMPQSPRSMDALIHPPLCKIATRLIDIIHTRTGENVIHGQRDIKEKANSWEQ